MGRRRRTRSSVAAPERGDLAWLDFDPQAGREQAGRGPALVLSPASYNERSGLAIVCPITSRVKGYTFEVVLPEDASVQGAILADHVRSIDWRSRRLRFIEIAGEEIVEAVSERISRLIN